MKMKRIMVWVAVLAALIGVAALLRRGHPPTGLASAGRPNPGQAMEGALPLESPAGAVVAAPQARPAAPASESRPAPAVPAPGTTGSALPTVVRGRVRISHDIPQPRKIRMDADPKCAAMYAEPPLMEDLVVDADKNVEWAFVYVEKGVEGKKPTDPPAPVVINQHGCHYEPHVLGVRVGQDLIIRNSDDLLHNIHALPFSNKEFNFGQPTRGLEERKQFTTQEIMVKVKCDIHPWMSAWIGVVDHPFFAVTGAAGDYVLPALPPGHYSVKVWHERCDSVVRELDLRGESEAVLDFVLDVKKP